MSSSGKPSKGCRPSYSDVDIGGPQTTTSLSHFYATLLFHLAVLYSIAFPVWSDLDTRFLSSMNVSCFKRKPTLSSI